MQDLTDGDFDVLEKSGLEGGAEGLVGRLVELLEQKGRHAELFEALLMRKRVELGLPVEGVESVKDVPEELHHPIEDAYIDACRKVGALFLEEGNIPAAWPYFQAIDEPEPVAEAIERWSPTPPEPGETTTDLSVPDAVIDIAIAQGVHPRRGFELVLALQGTCRAVTTFEHHFPYKGEVRDRCASLLVRRVREDLLRGIRSDIEGREGAPPPELDVPSLLENHQWLLQEHGFHVDRSHLQSAIRASLSISDRNDIQLAVELCDYGRRLARDDRVADPPPFEDFYNDHRIFLRALLGEGADGAVRFFSSKVERAEFSETGGEVSGEVLVALLFRLGRHREALDAHRRYLSSSAGPFSLIPSLEEICERSGDFAPVLDLARGKRDALAFARALVRRVRSPDGGEDGS